MTLRDLIKKHEGLRLKPYHDSTGNLSIGYGRNLKANGISELEAEFMLTEDIHKATLDLWSVLGDDVVWSLSDNRYNAFIDMMFNLGRSRFLTFKKMIAAAKIGDFEEAAEQMLDSKWARQTKSRAIELSEMVRLG